MKKLVLFIIFSVNLFAEQSYNMRLLSNLNQHSGFSPWSYSACWGYTALNGREYALLGCYSGTAFIDITDTNNIREVDFLPTPTPLSDIKNAWREMKTYSHYAYIVSEGDSSGVQIADLQYLPDSIHYLGQYFYPGHYRTHTISQSGSYLYLNGVIPGLSGTVVLDITNPTQPVKRGEWREMIVHDSRIVDNRMYAANIIDGYISIVDVSNKDSLRTITRFLNLPQPGPHNCDLTTDRNYLLVTDEINGSPRLLKIWDIRDILNPVQVATWQPTNITTAIVHNVEVKGDTAVIAHYSAGIRVINISNRSMPREIAWYDTYPQHDTAEYIGCWGVYMFPSGKIIGSDMQTGLYVVKTVVGIEPPYPYPFVYKLFQNYPNPFNPETSIWFQIPERNVVTVKIYNLLGQEIITVVNSELNANNYFYSVDMTNFASGIYFVKMSAGSYVESKKMILIK